MLQFALNANQMPLSSVCINQLSLVSIKTILSRYDRQRNWIIHPPVLVLADQTVYISDAFSPLQSSSVDSTNGLFITFFVKLTGKSKSVSLLCQTDKNKIKHHSVAIINDVVSFLLKKKVKITAPIHPHEVTKIELIINTKFPIQSHPVYNTSAVSCILNA